MASRLNQKISCVVILLGFLSKSDFCFSQQNDSLSKSSSATSLLETIKISGYVDAYYAHYTDSVGTNNYQKIPDISPKSDQFGLNIAQLTAQCANENVRAIATLHFGDIPSAAWSPAFNMIQEANAGIRISKKMWMDAGFFKTHIGTEALLPKDNITSSLSVITFYEPWWQAGMKLTYMASAKWLVCVHVLNGYNTFEENNKSKSVGLALTYTLNDKGSIGYYNLLGEESPAGSSKNHMRFLNNVVFNYLLTPKLKTSIGADYITQEHSKISNSNKTAVVYSAIATLRYQIKPKFALYARGETFSDKDGFLTGQFTDSRAQKTGYILNGGTVGFEFKPTDYAFIRIEGRDLVMEKRQKIFRTNHHNNNERQEVMINIGVSF